MRGRCLRPGAPPGWEPVVSAGAARLAAAPERGPDPGPERRRQRRVPAQAWSPRLQNFVMAERRSREAGSLLTEGSSLGSPSPRDSSPRPGRSIRARTPGLATGRQRGLGAGGRRAAGARDSSQRASGGLFRDPFPQRRRLPGLAALPAPLQLQLAPAVPTHLCEAWWPRGRRSEVGLGALPPGVQIQIPGRQLQLIRARRGGGKPGIRSCPAAGSRRGMVSPSPAPRAPVPASNRRAARCARSALWREACSAEPAA